MSLLQGWLSDFVWEIAISYLPWMSVNWLLAICLSVSLMHSTWLSVAWLFVAWLHLLVTCHACELATCHLAACNGCLWACCLSTTWLCTGLLAIWLLVGYYLSHGHLVVCECADADWQLGVCKLTACHLFVTWLSSTWVYQPVRLLAADNCLPESLSTLPVLLVSASLLANGCSA